MIVASFDMGLRNFAFVVEYFTNENFSDLIIPETNNRFNVDGTPSVNYDNFLKRIFRNGKLLECQRIDVVQFCKEHNIKNIYVGLTQILNQFTKLWDAVDVFLIEQQMSYGHNKSNIKALRLGQHCISYFNIIYLTKIVIEYPSTLKTRVLGCSHQQRTTHKSRKKFAICLANDILSNRDDECLSIYSKLDKRDDVSDCILMIQTYKVGLIIK